MDTTRCSFDALMPCPVQPGICHPATQQVSSLKDGRSLCPVRMCPRHGECLVTWPTDSGFGREDAMAPRALHSRISGVARWQSTSVVQDFGHDRLCRCNLRTQLFTWKALLRLLLDGRQELLGAVQGMFGPHCTAVLQLTACRWPL